MQHEHTDGLDGTGSPPPCRWSAPGAFGYTVRVLPRSEHMADPAELGVVRQRV
jgi:starch phosphorylase